MPTPTAAKSAVSMETVRRLRKGRDMLASSALRRIDDEFGWYRQLPAEDRSWVGLVAQTGVSAFISWCERPGQANGAAEIFAAAPPELIRTISLQYTLQLVRACVDVVEEHSESLAAPGSSFELRDAVLRYSREVAFSAAEVYARAAEVRGSWDARLEALVVDGLIRGESPETLRSRVSALGWSGQGPVIVIVGSAENPADEAHISELRRATRKSAPDSLVGIQSERVLVVLGGGSELRAAAEGLVCRFGPGPVVIGPEVTGFDDASRSVRAALAALAAVPAWPNAPRPVLADELLPERLLAGDPEARRTLIETTYRPLLAAGGELAGTLSAYLEYGRSLEAAARVLYVHPNTVRYRLKRIADICGWDPTDPRESYVLQLTLAVGRLADNPTL